VAAATRIAELEAALEELRQSNEELRRALKQAQTEVEDLRRKLGMNSLNSSLPPILRDTKPLRVGAGHRADHSPSGRQHSGERTTRAGGRHIGTHRASGIRA
jgi:hypothetical protein